MQVAARIEEDIRRRQLRPGDAYLNTEEVARMLGIGKSTANRAMQLLAKRNLVHRRQRLGVVVGDGIAQPSQPSLRCVHLLVHQNYLKTEGLMADGTLIGLQSALPGVDVQVNFLPAGDDTDSVNRVVSAALRSPHPEGFVLIRTPLAVQRLIQSIGLPAVVHGSLYPSVHDLAWVDFDHQQAARLLVEHLLKRGHRRVIYLGRDRVFPGDYAFQDGMIETLGEAGLTVSALTIRHLPADEELIKAEVRELLARKHEVSASVPDRVSRPGIIAQTEPLAEGVVAAIQSLGMTVGRDAALTAAMVYRLGNERPPCYPHIRSAVDPCEIGEHLGRLLANQAIGQPSAFDHELIPVVLRQETA